MSASHIALPELTCALCFSKQSVGLQSRESVIRGRLEPMNYETGDRREMCFGVRQAWVQIPPMYKQVCGKVPLPLHGCCCMYKQTGMKDTTWRLARTGNRAHKGTSMGGALTSTVCLTQQGAGSGVRTMVGIPPACHSKKTFHLSDPRFLHP